MRLLIKNGRVIDPANAVDEVLDVYVEDGRINRLDKHIGADSGMRVIDAEKMWVVPGLIDLHTHLREPGYEYKETIYHGTRAAAAGGFTTVCCMPNTSPVIDCGELVSFIKRKAESTGCVNVLPVGSITKGQKGVELSAIDEMSLAGACAVSDDGKSVENTFLMKQALIKAARNGIPVFSHCEELSLVNGGVVSDGMPEMFFLPTISNDSESVMVARDITVAAGIENARLHICHVSAAESVHIISTAKKYGVAVTAEVCPHHFALSNEDILTNDGNYKMNPPLRSRADVAAIKNALKNDIIEVIATDHAPHHLDEKNGGLKSSMFGIIGLETAVGLCVTELVCTNILTPSQLIKKLTTNPARILGCDRGTLSPGAIADIAIIDPDKRYVVHAEDFYSKARNTPFDGRELKGKAEYTIVSGKVVMERGVVND